MRLDVWITESGHDGCEDDDANRLHAELSDGIFVHVFPLHCPPREEQNHPRKKIEQRLQRRCHDGQRPALHRRKNLEKNMVISNIIKTIDNNTRQTSCIQVLGIGTQVEGGRINLGSLRFCTGSQQQHKQESFST